MKKVCALALIACLLLAFAPSAMAAPPEERNVYDMDFTLDTDNKSISGTFDITAYNDSDDAWDELCLRDYTVSVLDLAEENEAGSGGVSEIAGVTDAQSGEPLDFRLDDTDPSVVYVELSEPLAPGGRAGISIDFYADVPHCPFNYAWNEAPEGSGKYLFELANFYPVLAIYEDGGWVWDEYINRAECFYSKCADYSATFRLPEDYVVAASGSEEMTGGEDGLAVWEINAENMRDITITASNNLSSVSGEWEGITFNSYYFTEGYGEEYDYDPAANAEDVLRVAMDSTEYFTGLIGPYPYDELDIVPMFGAAGGLEFPALVRLSKVDNLLATYDEFYEDTDYDRQGIIDFFNNDVTAHEVGHQWFYAVVGNDCYNEAWLDEGFTTFITFLYTSKDMSEAEVSEETGWLKEWMDEETKGLYLNESYAELGDEYSTVVYEKGQVFLTALMDAMGEDTFIEMLKEYYGTWSFSEVTTEDFVSLVYEYDDSGAVKSLVDEYIKF